MLRRERSLRGEKRTDPENSAWFVRSFISPQNKPLLGTNCVLSTIPATGDTDTNQPPAVFFKAGTEFRTQRRLRRRPPTRTPGVGVRGTRPGPAPRLGRPVPLPAVACWGAPELSVPTPEA